jgi:3-oxoacyl-[acyl-carrier-protein] synthase-3
MTHCSRCILDDSAFALCKTTPHDGDGELMYASRIAGTGSYLPERCLSNKDLEKIVETSDEWILERTGIANRHIADSSQATSDLAYEAAQRAMKEAGLSGKDLDAILVATVTGDQCMPSTACLLQARLGCRSIMALDISAACSGFVYGLSIADNFVKTGMFKNVLVLGAETLSRIMNYEDRQTCILFGDGAGAAVLSRAPEGSPSRIYSAHLGAQGELGDVLTLTGGGSRIPFSQEVLDKKLHLVQMKGREVFKAAVRALVERCEEALEANHMSVDDLTWVLTHQANVRIIEAVSQNLGIPAEKQLINIRDTGNTSSASIPILFDQSIREGKIKRGDTVLFAAFGAGVTSGSLLLKY